VVDTATGERAGYRENERFPMCSTFKFLLATTVLQKVDRGQERLEREVAVPPQPLLGHSPLTAPHAGGTMTVEALCSAVLIESDNSAANLLLALLGGPAALTGFARSIADPVTRLDRIEPDLNESRDHDPRDTTSPSAMANDLHAILLGDVLSSGLRNRITHWMQDCVTGLDRLRAHLPAGWRAADRTGSSGTHTSNDVGVFWPPNAPPVIVAAFITQCAGPEARRTTMLARIGELVVESLRSPRSSVGGPHHPG
jgi:beta-lactamase class A